MISALNLRIIRKKLFRKLVARESLKAACGRLFYLAYFFILRLPSGALPAVRASPRDSLFLRCRLAQQPALGLRTLPDGEHRLVLELKTRKHVREGSFSRGPDFATLTPLPIMAYAQFMVFG